MDREIALIEADGTKRIVRPAKSEQKRDRLVAAIVMLVMLAGTIGYSIGENQSKPKPLATAKSDSVTTTTAPTQAYVTFASQSVEQMEQQWKVEEAQSNHELQKKLAIVAKWNARPILAPPVDAPPKMIKVGPYFYSVNYTSTKALDSQNALALTMLEARQIWLDPSRTASLRDDVVHELLHCARDLGTGGGRFAGWNGNKEEIDIEGFSAGFLGIMQDNPELLTWLSARPRD